MRKGRRGVGTFTMTTIVEILPSSKKLYSSSSWKSMRFSFTTRELFVSTLAALVVAPALHSQSTQNPAANVSPGAPTPDPRVGLRGDGSIWMPIAEKGLSGCLRGRYRCWEPLVIIGARFYSPAELRCGAWHFLDHCDVVHTLAVSQGRC